MRKKKNKTKKKRNKTKKKRYKSNQAKTYSNKWGKFIIEESILADNIRNKSPCIQPKIKSDSSFMTTIVTIIGASFIRIFYKVIIKIFI